MSSSTSGDPPTIPNHTGSGVCMMNMSWRDDQHPSLIHFISSFLATNSYCLNFLPIAPDFIFNNGGMSVAFVFVTYWDDENSSALFSRVEKLRKQFKHLYVVVCVPTREQNDSFNLSYFKYGVKLGNPTFVPVRDPEMGFEKMLKIAHARGVCKQQEAVSMMKHELAQAVGSIEAIAKASKGFILESTDLSVDKAERIVSFFRDPDYYLGPKIN